MCKEENPKTPCCPKTCRLGRSVRKRERGILGKLLLRNESLQGIISQRCTVGSHFQRCPTRCTRRCSVCIAQRCTWRCTCRCLEPCTWRRNSILLIERFSWSVLCPSLCLRMDFLRPRLSVIWVKRKTLMTPTLYRLFPVSKIKAYSEGIRRGLGGLTLCASGTRGKSLRKRLYRLFRTT